MSCRALRGFAVCVACLWLGGCAGVAPWLARNINVNGARVGYGGESVHSVDLAQTILAASTPEQTPSACAPPAPTTGQTGAAGVAGSADLGCLEQATRVFYADRLEQRQRRDQVQARLLAASDRACQIFTQDLNTLQSTTNLGLGLLTTGFAAAGAIVTQATAARILSGLAAGATGARAEFNADYFYKEAVPVIVKAIDTDRHDYVRDVITINRAKSIEDYTLWDAIGDAIRYNEKCSLVSGLSQIQTALIQAESPGLDAINRTLLKTQQTRAIQAGLITSPAQLISDASTTPSAVAAAQQGGTRAGTDLVHRYRRALVGITTTGDALLATLRQIAQSAPTLTPHVAKLQTAIATTISGLTNSCPAIIAGEVRDVVSTTLADAGAATDVGQSLALARVRIDASATGLRIDAFATAALAALGQGQTAAQEFRADPNALALSIDTVVTQLPTGSACQ